ncbi:S1 family peptidase [Methylobacterium gossipiicola]|uniref:Trypsin-like peptidase domain-containing protein n=1 Tax=Methylobacterium gossipiicola TaxID=582675 RepID=A0A1I2TM68_9HYPH|nr:serine protease [Methylobacterium gossipiicola]SFG65229.1 Trypsin-like peptidase domain-containing protein [Methylobacterium gossipiicola]
MLSLLDQVPYLTVRIEANRLDGTKSTGTGFHFGVDLPSKGHMSLVGTNKHVLEGANIVVIHISQAGEDGMPIPGSYIRLDLENFQNIVELHPDPEVDLAMFPISAALNEMQKRGLRPFFRQLRSSDIPDAARTKTIRAIEEITMIGYPIGLWDSRNNFPIIRRGITATPFGSDYNGKKEFMVDTACFPGSSGSPVLIANSGMFTDSSGTTTAGERLMFLGVLWGGPQYTTEGNIIAKPVPTNYVPISVSSMPTNLGYCLKSERVLEMQRLLIQKWGSA